MADPDLTLLRIVIGDDGRVGAWVRDAIVDLNRAFAATVGGGGATVEARAAERVPADLGALIERGEAGIDDARAAVEHALREGAGAGAGGGPIVVPATSVRLRPPTVVRPRIACAAGNYAAHTLGSAARKGVAQSRALTGLVEPMAELPSEADLTERTRERGRPRGFWKDFALPFGPEDDIPRPARAERFDYEGEVAIVIGRPAHDVVAGRGADHIWGVTLLNDWSIRGASVKDSLSFNLSKNFDGGASIGPSIVVGGLDPSDLIVETRVNGDVRQHYHSGDMIFDHAMYIEYLSRDLTLLPGDMVSGGSGPGSATDATKGDDPDFSLFLDPGDLVEVETDAVGILRNRIVAPTGSQ